MSHLVGNTTSDAEAIILLEPGEEGKGVVVEKHNELDLIDRWMDVGLIKGVSVTTFHPSVWHMLTILGSMQDIHNIVSTILTDAIISQGRPNLFPVMQCGPGPTEEACRLDGGEQYAECPEYEASCDEMQAEYQWLDRMSLEDSIP